MVHQNEKYQGQFFEDFCNWRRIPEYTDFIFNSNLASIASNLMGSKSVQFFHDHFFEGVMFGDIINAQQCTDGFVVCFCDM